MDRSAPNPIRNSWREEEEEEEEGEENSQRKRSGRGGVEISRRTIKTCLRGPRGEALLRTYTLNLPLGLQNQHCGRW